MPYQKQPNRASAPKSAQGSKNNQNARGGTQKNKSGGVSSQSKSTAKKSLPSAAKTNSGKRNPR